MSDVYKQHFGSWTEPLREAIKVYEDKTRPKLKEVDPKLITPGNDNIFRAFRECPWEDLKVVILGMDPYFDGSATGLIWFLYGFSVIL